MAAPQVRVARTVAEVTELRTAWQELQNDQITADLDHFLAVLDRNPSVVRPHVLVLERAQGVTTLVVARVEDIELPCSLGYRTVYAPTARAILVVFGGLLGASGEEEEIAIVAELEAALARGEADVVLMRHLPLDSAFRRVALARTPAYRRQHAAPVNRYWETSLPDSYDAFMRSRAKTTRDGFRRYSNRFMREFGERLAIRELRAPGELDELCRDVESVAAKSWQRGLGIGFVDDARTRARMLMGLERGWLRAYVLSLDGQPISFWMGEAYRGRFRTDIPGYDPAYSQHRVGNHLLLHVIGALCADPEIRILDFGLGDVAYKERLAERSVEVADLTIYARSFRALRINLLRSVLLGLNGVARRSAGALGVAGRAKNAWRRRSSRRAGTSGGERPGESAQGLSTGDGRVPAEPPPPATPGVEPDRAALTGGSPGER